MRQLTQEEAIKETSYMRKLRHDMHISADWYEWEKMLNEFREEVERTRLGVSIELPTFEDSACWCNRDDCDIEYCSHCQEIEQEMLADNKERVNAIIEEWMKSLEEYHDLPAYTIAPTGISRSRWTESALYN